MILPLQEWQPLSSVLELKKYPFSAHATDQRQSAYVSFYREKICADHTIGIQHDQFQAVASYTATQPEGESRRPTPAVRAPPRPHGCHHPAIQAPLTYRPAV